MPNVTVTAPDTATAMDEIWDQLGSDAMIVSTKKQHGKIVMEAAPRRSPKRLNQRGPTKLALAHYSPIK